MAGPVAASGSGPGSERLEVRAPSCVAAVLVDGLVVLSCDVLLCLAALSAGLSAVFLSAIFLSAVFLSDAFFSADFFSPVFLSAAFFSDVFVSAFLTLGSALLACLAGLFSSAVLAVAADAGTASSRTAASVPIPKFASICRALCANFGIDKDT